MIQTWDPDDLRRMREYIATLPVRDHVSWPDAALYGLFTALAVGVPAVVAALLGNGPIGAIVSGAMFIAIAGLGPRVLRRIASRTPCPSSGSETE